MGKGEVRVAKYYPGKFVPELDDFVSVLIHTSSQDFAGDLSPFVLKDENGYLLENVWQFSKLYAETKAQRIPLSWKHHPNTIIWEHPAEKFVDEHGEPNYAWWAWRQKGFLNEKAVRYPVGFRDRHKCLCAIWPDGKGGYERLDYIQSRKKIYCAEYARLAHRSPSFQNMKRMVEEGKNILIVEVDGPDPELIHAPYDQISAEQPALLINEENIRLLINDPVKPFGHGFTIAALLLDGAEWMT